VSKPDGYAVRPATEDDVDAIDDLVQAHDLAGSGQADPSREQLLEDFRTPGVEPARDTWYVTDAHGDLAAFVLYKDREPGEEGAQGFGRVHPEHRGRGIGASLVDTVDRRWLEGDAPREGVLRHRFTRGTRAGRFACTSEGMTVRRGWEWWRNVSARLNA
jgi:GNAT superfamily N-acetyltransferase